MRNEKLYDALTDVDEALIDEASEPAKQPKKRAARLRWLGAIAAAVAAAILLTAILRPGGDGGLTAYALETPVYPASAPYPDYSAVLAGEPVDEEAFEAAYDAWFEVRQQRMNAMKNYSPAMLRSWLTAAIPAFLGGRDGENAACSPLNLYLSLAMLAETTGGETRDQILSLLGIADMDSLRTLANNLFLGNYCDDGASKSLLAGAIWLRSDMDYNAETVKRLAETYYASSFRGKMGSEEYDALLRQWLNEQTGNRLADQIGGLSFDPGTVMAITTTVDYAARWDDEFRPERTDDAVFHARSGELPCRMMHQEEDGYYYWGEQFGAAELLLMDGGKMRFLLPDEGVTAEELLTDPEAISFLLTAKTGAWANGKYLKVRLSLPKFDISSQLDLERSLQDLGLTDVFDPNAADFSPLSGTKGAYLSQVTHGARVSVDEEGVVAGAFTMMGAGAAMPPDEEIDFTLDRPFLFVIYGADGLPLFVGIVNQP